MEYNRPRTADCGPQTKIFRSLLMVIALIFATAVFVGSGVTGCSGGGTPTTGDGDGDGDGGPEPGLTADCGDLRCTGDETNVTCAGDCPLDCGNGVCGETESANTCEADCLVSCGDGFCTHSEDALSCPGECSAVCGDTHCTHDENVGSCDADCDPSCGDGECNETDTVENCPGDCHSVCGDLVVSAGEECDDGNTDNTDACVSCQVAECGDSFVHTGVEECDDGNRIDTDACTNLCRTAVCGDEIVREGVEECEDRNSVNTDGCLNTCMAAKCGDGVVWEDREACDDPDTAVCVMCALPTCGDGVVHDGEACDDANDDNTDACLSTCIAASCGDGFVREGVEGCDDANDVNIDACKNNCTNPTCGDGLCSTRGGESFKTCAADCIVQTKILASDGSVNDYFGYSVSISGNTMVIGAPESNVIPAIEFSGSVYVFVQDAAGGWNERKLVASDLGTGDKFGKDVSINGDVLIVGAPYKMSDHIPVDLEVGAVYIFTRGADGNWAESKLTSASGDPTGDRLGLSVSISSRTAVAGSLDDERGLNSGAAWRYTFDDIIDDAWEESGKFYASDPGRTDFFADSLSLRDSFLIAGAPGDDAPGLDSGSAYIFVKNKTTGVWGSPTKLAPGGAGDLFGSAVSITENIAVVGAPYDDDHGADSGSIYIYERDVSSGAWSSVRKRTATDGAGGDRFGSSAAINSAGTVLIVGAPLANSGRGAAYIFTKNDLAGWVQTAKLTASDGVASDRFGVDVSVSGYKVIVGAYRGNNAGGFETGAAYVYDLLR